jgi:predicted lysophospholipase L1 biosynthesis ABC-type transport system permease subunit
MTPTFDDEFTDHATPPVVISQQLAELYRVTVGDTVSFSLQNAYDRTTGRVALIVPAIPGAGLESAVLVDLGYVLHQRLRLVQTPDPPHEFWIDTDDPGAAISALRPQLPANTRMQPGDDAAGRTVLGSAATALWFGAVGCLLLAVVTVIAVLRAQLRSRRLEIAVLRAIGFGSRDQAAVRRMEYALVLGFGAVVGIGSGLVVSLLTVPQLARAAVIDPYTSVPTPLLLDPLGLAAGLAALLLAMLTLVGVFSARVAAQARAATGTEELT